MTFMQSTCAYKKVVYINFQNTEMKSRRSSLRDKSNKLKMLNKKKTKMMKKMLKMKMKNKMKMSKKKKNKSLIDPSVVRTA